MAELLGIRVLRRRPPGAGALGVLELQDHEARRAPVTLETLGLAAASDVAPAVLIDGGRREVLVVGVALGIVDVDFDDDVGGHQIWTGDWLLGLVIGYWNWSQVIRTPHTSLKRDERPGFSCE